MNGLFTASPVAGSVPYDNESSGIPGTNVQEAIDNLASGDIGPHINQTVRKISVLADGIFQINNDFGQMRILSPSSASDVNGMQIQKLVRINSDASMSIDSTSQVKILGV